MMSVKTEANTQKLYHTAIISMVKGGCTRYYEVDGGDRIPAEAHRVTHHQLRFLVLEIEVHAAVPAVANQSVDVVRQPQQLAVNIFQLQLQKVAAALDPVHALHHVNHAHQREPPARTERTKQIIVKCASHCGVIDAHDCTCY